MGRLREPASARVSAVIGGLTCLAITPWFALSYFDAHGTSSGEVPPPWEGWIEWPTLISGANPVDTYNRYGIVYGLGLGVVVASLFVLIGSMKLHVGRRRPVNIALAGLGAVAFGSVLEYGFGEYLDASFGFFIELLGFLAVIVAPALLGISIWREGANRLLAGAIALSGLAAIIIGTGLVGHLPSGPALVPVVAAIGIGLSRSLYLRVDAAPAAPDSSIEAANPAY